MSFIYKPQTSKGPVFLSSGGPAEPPTIKLPDGTVVTGKRLNTVDEGGGPVTQYVFPPSVLGQKGATLSFGGKTQTLDNSNMSYRGDSIGNLQESSKGAIGDMSGSSSGVPGGFGPGNIGYGSFPGYIGNMFPNAQLSPTAPYKFTDPMKFGEKFGAFSRKEITKNFDLSKDLALKELSTELDSLKGFVPAAAALKRNETSLDNQFNRTQIAADNTFNQGERTSQVNQVLPNARADLEGQRARANAFASGRVPDSIQDRALELGVRSAAADRASAGGFGASSSVARKASDLLSTSERIALSKYGDNLLSSNISQEANLFLAPTEYSKAELSNAGGQINVMPSVSASQLIDRNIAQINGLASIPATNAFGSEVQQNQFRTNQVQQNSQYNTTTQNQFALDKFGYQAGYANSVAGAAQTNTNTQIGLDQQAMYQQIMQQYMVQAQNAQQLQSIFSGAGALFQGLGGFSGIMSGFNSIFGGGGNGGANFAGDAGSGGSAAEAAGSAAGTAAGSYFGGPEGAAIGSQIGAQLGPKVQDVGSKIIDSVSSVS